MYHRVGERRLLRAPDNDDGQLERAAVGGAVIRGTLTVPHRTRGATSGDRCGRSHAISSKTGPDGAAAPHARCGTVLPRSSRITAPRNTAPASRWRAGPDACRQFLSWLVLAPNDSRAAWPLTFDDVGNGVLAQSDFAADQAIAPTLGDEGRSLGASRSDLGRCPGWRPRRLPRALAAAMPERMRSWISSRSNSAMPASTVAIIRPCGVERSNAMPFSAITDTRRASNSFSVASRSVVLRPQRDIGHQHRVDLPRLRERHDLAPLGPVELHAGAGFLERADHLVACARGKRREIPLLARAGLVGGRDPAIESGALSQLNSPAGRPANPCSCWGRTVAISTTLSIGTIAMPRRRALTEAQLESLLALPVIEADLVRQWTWLPPILPWSSAAAAVTISLAMPCSSVRCAIPAGCSAWRDHPEPAFNFVADQLGSAPMPYHLRGRSQTRASNSTGCGGIRLPHVAQAMAANAGMAVAGVVATTNPVTVAAALMVELRRRQDRRPRFERGRTVGRRRPGCGRASRRRTAHPQPFLRPNR